MTRLEAKQRLCNLLDISLTDIANNDLFTEAMLNNALQDANTESWDLHRWPWSEDCKTQTPIAQATYYDIPDDFVSDSPFYIEVNGKEFERKSWQSYRKYLEDYPDGTKKYYALFKRYIFINENAYSANQAIDLYGKLKAPILDEDTDLLMFSPNVDNQEYNGNKAVVKLAFANILDSDKMKAYDQAIKERNEAIVMLERLWKPFAEMQAQEHETGRPFFNVPDMFEPRYGRNYKAGTFENQ